VDKQENNNTIDYITPFNNEEKPYMTVEETIEELLLGRNAYEPHESEKEEWLRRTAHGEKIYFADKEHIKSK
jgi:hypothetical protein